MSHSTELRRELIALAEDFVNRHNLEPYVYRSRGPRPTVLFKPFQMGGQERHGNFLTESYRAILNCKNWKIRLNKAGRKRALHQKDKSAAKELDSCNSSDALLMNVFCHPSTRSNKDLARLLGLPQMPVPEFGFNANLPFTDGTTEPRSSEIDLRLQDSSTTSPVFVEAKLTEPDFKNKPKSKVERYVHFAHVFDVSALPSEEGVEPKYLHYQILRNILAAHHYNGRFVLVFDERRPDLQTALDEVLKAVKTPEIRNRCRSITWQQLAAAVSTELRLFLQEKYKIEPQP